MMSMMIIMSICWPGDICLRSLQWQRQSQLWQEQAGPLDPMLVLSAAWGWSSWWPWESGDLLLVIFFIGPCEDLINILKLSPLPEASYSCHNDHQNLCISAINLRYMGMRWFKIRQAIWGNIWKDTEWRKVKQMQSNLEYFCNQPTIHGDEVI